MARYLQTDREVPFAKSDPKKLLNSSPIFSSYVVSVMNLKRSRNVKKIGAIFFLDQTQFSVYGPPWQFHRTVCISPRREFYIVTDRVQEFWASGIGSNRFIVGL